MRILLGALGVLVGAYGAWLLLSRQDADQLISAGLWLAAGVVLHDAVLATAVLLLGAVALRPVPRAARGPLVAGFVVLGSVTLLAVPVLGRFGARADNPTLLDRDYTAGWLTLAGLTLLAVLTVLTAALVRSHRDPDAGGGDRGPRHRGRRRPLATRRGGLRWSNRCSG
jgi:hypothetical protein